MLALARRGLGRPKGIRGLPDNGALRHSIAEIAAAPFGVFVGRRLQDFGPVKAIVLLSLDGFPRQNIAKAFLIMDPSPTQR